MSNQTMVEQQRNPIDAVFTTCLLNDGKILDADLHFQRIHDHAERLRIRLHPEIRKNIIKSICDQLKDHSSSSSPELLRIEICRDENILCSTRPLPAYQPFLQAISMELPNWNQAVLGCKHGDWGPYKHAHEIAQQHHCQLAIFMNNNTIIDADRATPVLLDRDGVLWMSAERYGAVRSLTLESILNDVKALGFEVQYGHITEKMILHCRELLAVGTGIGVATIDRIDGIEIGEQSQFAQHIYECLQHHRNNSQSWLNIW